MNYFLPSLIKADADADADYLIKTFLTILLPTPTPILKKKKVLYELISS